MVRLTISVAEYMKRWHGMIFGNLIYDLMRKCKMPNGDYSRVEGVLKVCKRVVAGKA